MQNLDDLQPTSPEQGFQFPGLFEITAMGAGHAGLEQKVPALLESVGLSVIAGSLRTRPSSQGNYLSVAVSFTCPSREKYDEAHAALRSDPAIRWTI